MHTGKRMHDQFSSIKTLTTALGSALNSEGKNTMTRYSSLTVCPKRVRLVSGFCVAALGFATLPALAQSTPGSVTDPNLFSGKAVTSSTAFGGFDPSNAVDGSTNTFVFLDDQPNGSDILTISGLTSSLNTIRFFDSGQFTNRVSPSVTITASDGTAITSVGTFTLPTVVGNGQGPSYYTTPSAEAGISYDTLSGLNIPTGTTSLQFNFTRARGDGPAFAEIEGFNIAPAEAPEPSQALAFCVGVIGLSIVTLKARKRSLTA